MAKEKKVKKITLGLIASWVFGILFFFGGIAVMTEGSITIGILVIIGSIFLIPAFDDLIKEKLNIEISGGVKFALIVTMLILMGIGSVGESRRDSDVEVQPTEEAQPDIEEPAPEPIVAEPKKKIKSATLSIDKIQIQLGNLYPTRVTVTNTGDVKIRPKFDIYVYDSNNKEVCSGSPMVDEFNSIDAGDKKTGELTMIGCMFDKDGTYTLKIDLLDSDYNKLDTDSKGFEVNYWSQFEI